MTLSRPPRPALRPYVSQLWASDPLPGDAPHPVREHMLPNGAMHLVVRLGDAPLHIVPAESGRTAQSIHGAMIGGPRASYYLRSWSVRCGSVGAVLRPGAALPLLRAPASEFAGRHVELGAVWGGDAARLRERLLDASDGAARLDLFEAALTQRLHAVPALHPGIARVLQRWSALPDVASAVALSGLSHRHFLERFRQAVGLGPKTLMRIARFQRGLALLRDHQVPLSTLAFEAGYSDQAHFCREFLALAGVTPTAYRQQQPTDANHLALHEPAPGDSGQIRSRRD